MVMNVSTLHEAKLEHSHDVLHAGAFFTIAKPSIPVIPHSGSPVELGTCEHIYLCFSHSHSSPPWPECHKIE